MHYDCDERRAIFLDRNWRFICRSISLYCGLSIWAIFSIKPNENPYNGLSFASFFVFLTYAFLYELQQANSYTYFGNSYRKIIRNLHYRTAETGIGILEERLVRGQFVVLAIPLTGGIALVYPETAYVVSFLIGLLASKLGEFFWEEQTCAPKEHKMPVTTWFSVILFSAFLAIAWTLDVYGLQYSVSNASLPFFAVGLGSWFAIGFIGQLIISAIEGILHRLKPRH